MPSDTTNTTNEGPKVKIDTEIYPSSEQVAKEMEPSSPVNNPENPETDKVEKTAQAIDRSSDEAESELPKPPMQEPVSPETPAPQTLGSLTGQDNMASSEQNINNRQVPKPERPEDINKNKEPMKRRAPVASLEEPESFWGKIRKIFGGGNNSEETEKDLINKAIEEGDLKQAEALAAQEPENPDLKIEKEENQK